MKSLRLLPPPGGRDLASAERGFTVLELTAVMALLAVLLTFGATAFRQYWLVHTLESAQGDVATQLRQIQSRVASESHPFIYGARFTPGSPVWSLVKYDQGTNRLTTDDDSCSADGAVSPLGGVEVVAPPASGFTAPLGVDLSKCGGSHSTDVFVMFYARGTATAGKLTLRSRPTDRTRVITVSALTSRVEEL